MLRLYDYLESGNGYKVRLLLNQLGLEFERIELDIVAGETRTPEYLAKNPNGRILLLELDDGPRAKPAERPPSFSRVPGQRAICAYSSVMEGS